MKRALILILVVLATVAGALLMWELRSVVILLVAAIALGAAIRPAADKMNAIGVPRVLSILLMTLLILVLVLGTIGILGFALGEELPHMLRDVQGRLLQIRMAWSDGAPWQQTISQNIPQPVSLDQVVMALDGMGSTEEAGGVADLLPSSEDADAPLASEQPSGTPASEREESASAMLRVILGAVGGVAGFIAQFVILVFLSLYWSLEHEWFERMWISLLPARLRQTARTTWRAVESNVGAHIRSEVLQSMIAGALIFLGLRLLGVEQPLLLGTLVALAWLVPLVGGVLALTILLPIALLSPLWVTIASAVLILAVLALMEFVIEPRLDRGRERTEIFGLIMAMVMLQVFGLIGLLLASPIAVLVLTVLTTWEPEVGEVTDESRVSLESSLRRRMATLRQMIASKDEVLPQRTRSLYERLEGVVQAAESDAALRLDDIGPIPQTATAGQGTDGSA